MPTPKEPLLSEFEDALLDSLLEQVVVIDVSGRIRWVNDAWRSAAEQRGANLDAVSPGASYLSALEDSARTDFAVARILRGINAVLAGTLRHFEAEYECSSQNEFRYFVERVTPLKHPDGGAVIAHLDITKQKLAERERDAQRLQLARAASAAALGQLSGAIAHELSQPLTAILSSAQLAEARLEGTMPNPELAADIEDIVRDSRRAGQILSRIRDLLGQSRARSESIDVNRLIEGTLALCASELRSDEIRAELSLSPELPPVRGDSIGLQQVILNLIMNSYEAMKSVEAHERRLRITTAKTDPKHVAVEVEDTGPGLSPEAAERLYEPLFTTKPDGMGLGLSISRSIVEAHDGTLSIASRSSVGAVGRMTLPIAVT